MKQRSHHLQSKRTMQFIEVLRSMWFALVAPHRIVETISTPVTAFFAVAVVVSTMVSLSASYIEDGQPALRAENAAFERMSLAKDTTSAGAQVVDLSPPARTFTAVLGGALIKNIMPIVVLAGVFLSLVRFMTNAPLKFGAALSIVSASTSILCLELLLNTALHVILGTNRAGIHAGVFVDPSAHGFLFLFLQNLAPLSLWRYVVIASAMAQASGLHPRYGVVLGPTVWAVVVLAMGLLSFNGFLFYGL